MQYAPIPANEPARLEALASYKLLDTPSEEVYEEITLIAAEICGTPMATLSLLDEKREWLKSKQGLEIDEAPRTLSFCAHAILEPEMMIVPDARYDERFYDNPFTVGEPHVVFYAGVPIISEDGFPLGVLAVVDTRPRELSEQKRMALKELARLAATHFELRKLKMQLEEGHQNQQETQQLLEKMLGEVETLLKKNPRPDQIDRLDTLRNTAHTLIQNQYKLNMPEQ